MDQDTFLSILSVANSIGRKMAKALRPKEFQKISNSIPDNFASELLDVREHLKDGIYLFDNLDLGVTFEIAGIYDEPLTNEELNRRLKTVFSSINDIAAGIPSHLNPKNTVIQLILSQRKETEPLTKRLSCGSFHEFSKSVEGRALKEEEKLIFSQISPVNRTFYLAIRYTPIERSQKKSISELFAGILEGTETTKKAEHELVDKHIRTFNEALARLENGLRLSFNPRRCFPEELIEYYQNVLNCGRKTENYPARTFMNDAVWTWSNFPSNSDGDLVFENNTSISQYYLSQFPEEFQFGPIRYFIDSIPNPNFELIWTFSEGQKDYSTELIAKESWFGKSPKKQNEYQEFVHFRSNISAQKPHGVLSLKLLIYDRSEELESKIQGAALDFLDGRIVKERDISYHQLATSLPMNCKSIQNKIKCRFKRMRLENAIAFLPILDGPKTANGTRWQISRNLTPTNYDFFSGEGARFLVVIGRTRAGKSVFIQLKELEFLDRFQNGIIRKIEIKTSSQKLCDLVGGKIIRFSEEELKRDPYSPFAIENPDLDDLDSIHLIIKTAIIQKNIDIKINATHDEILKESLKLAYNTHATNKRNAAEFGSECDPHPIWPDVIAQMPTVCNNLEATGVKGVEAAREELARWSVNLYPTGCYGFLFSRHETRERSKELERYIVYDLDGISDPILRQLSSMMAFVKISKDLSSLPKEVTKLVEIDEFGTLQNGNDEAQKINEEQSRLIIKTAAKFNTVLAVIDNDVSTFSEKPAGITMWNNKTGTAFLPLGSMYENAHSAWNKQFNEAEWQIIKSLEKQPHLKRSMAYVSSEHEKFPWKGSLFIPLSPFMDALTTSSPSQLQVYEYLRAKGEPCMDSLLEMAKSHPYGSGLGDNK